MLNKTQQKAVEYVKGPLLIVAGAGTGKTTVITQKIAYLIEKKLANPEEILALTFTDKAAAEMLERVDKNLDMSYSDIQISTFHAFCQRILEHYGLDIGISNQFKLLTQTDAWLLIKENLDKFNLKYYRPLGNPTRHVHELIKHFSKCKDELVSPQDYLKHAEGVKMDSADANVDERSRLTEISNAYHTYNQLLLDKNCLDFGDLIFYTIKLLQERPRVLKLLQERYKHILVDEFQDVNYAQYELVRLLCGVGAQLTVVGDDDQSIYAFRGASVSNILRFKDDYLKAKEIVLTENYRSGQEILDLAYKSIQNNNPDRLEAKLKIDKSLKSLKSLKSKVEHLHYSTLEDEVRGVVNTIREIHKKESVVWDDFAILIRANSHAEPFIAGLEAAGIPYEFLASSGLYRQPIVLDCVNFLRAIDNYHESSAIYRLLRMPFLGLKENDLQKLSHNRDKKTVSFYEALKRAQEFDLSKDGVAIADKLVTLIHDGMKQSRFDKPGAVILNFLENSGYLKYITSEEEQGNAEVIRQIYQMKQFFTYVQRYEELNPGAHVAGFLDHFESVLESGDEGDMYQPTDTPDSVNIITVHKAKGLEFKYVFVVNLVEDRFPSRRRGEAIELPGELVKEKLPEGDFHIQEERRLFYVAITRAKEGLFLTSADNYGGAREKKMSRFIAEAGFNSQERKTKEKREKISNFKFQISKQVKPVGEFVYYPPTSLSYSKINCYQRCPYQYKLAHVLEIPTKGNAAFSFGQTMHGALHKFYSRVQTLNSVKQDSLFATSLQVGKLAGVQVPTFDELLKMYEESWVDDWYKGKTQKEDYYKKGKEVLKVFYKTQEGNWTIPVNLESFFKIKVGNCFINGRIDRIDKHEDGTLEIVDYKTGKSKEKVTGDDKNQLLIYQIAAQTLTEYKNIGKVAKLTFYYLEDEIKTSFIGDDEELVEIQDKISEVIKEIQSGNFTATPSEHTCGFCDFKEICEFRKL